MRRVVWVGLLAVLLGLGGHQALATWVWRSLALGPVRTGPLPVGLQTLSAEGCRPCHPTQFADWSSSAMGRAMTDPVFLADYQDQGEPFVCLFCHAPLQEQQPTIVAGLWAVRPLVPWSMANPNFDRALQQEGVTCVVCHLRDGAIVGPTGKTAPHPTRADPSFREATRCVGCHQVAIPPLANLERPLADTHREWEAWKALMGRTETCTDCHMPGRAHLWPGAWNGPLLREGLGVTVDADKDTVRVTLENRSGHNYPTADPARALVVRVGSTETVLARRVPLPALRDEGDTTLVPGERRTLVFFRGASNGVEVLMQPARFLAVPQSSKEVPIAAFPLPN